LNSTLTTNITNANIALKSYTDASIGALNSTLTTSITNANVALKSYTDASIGALNSTLTTNITNANIALKSYTDTSINNLTTFISETYATLSRPSFTGTIISINDVSINSRLFVGQDASFNGNVFVMGNIVAPTLPIATNSDLVATTAYVQNQGYVTQNTLFRQFM
jgi:hypothetical protein